MNLAACSSDPLTLTDQTLPTHIKQMLITQYEVPYRLLSPCGGVFLEIAEGNRGVSEQLEDAEVLMMHKRERQSFLFHATWAGEERKREEREGGGNRRENGEDRE